MIKRLDSASSRVPDSRVPDSIKHPLSLQADYANPHLYGGAAFIVGIVGLIGALVSLLLGNYGSAGILALLGLVLMLAGFLVARYGA